MQFHVLSFEGPDTYAFAGGLASRMTGLVHTLAEADYETHLWFVGDPDLPGHETRDGLQLHRWCQWISVHHPGGVYDGEEGKRTDYAASLPPHLWQHVLMPYLQQGHRAIILAEEWHTVDAVLHLDWLQNPSLLWSSSWFSVLIDLKTHFPFVISHFSFVIARKRQTLYSS